MKGRSSLKGPEEIVPPATGGGRLGRCMEKRNVKLKTRRKTALETPKITLTQATTLETRPAPQMNGRITQTIPDTERGGGQDKIRKNHPQPSPRKKNEPGTHLADFVLPTTPLVRISRRDTLYPWTGLPIKSVAVGTYVCCLLRGIIIITLFLSYTVQTETKLVRLWKTPGFHLDTPSKYYKYDPSCLNPGNYRDFRLIQGSIITLAHKVVEQGTARPGGNTFRTSDR